MKVYLSADMEGVAGVVSWDQCRAASAGSAASPRYAEGVELLLGEVNAAVEGAVAAGADTVVVNDSHGAMLNLPPQRLARRARYLSGAHKPRYMMEGLDSSYDAVVYVGYHGSARATGATLPHTYNPNAVVAVRVLGDGLPAEGLEVGEAGVNALVAAHFRVPVVAVTGDRTTVEETQQLLPRCRGVVVKQSLSAFSALSDHPDAAREAIRAEVEQALRMTSDAQVPRLAPGSWLRVELRTADLAAQAELIKGVQRVDERVVEVLGADTISVFDRFIGAVLLTRELSRL
ncbi:MAG: M55 family metallopeptidase [Actinomycetales bacterium]